ncbi:MAG: hypothetical protein V4676_09775 [Bacteroidota bacterium]
MDNRERNEPRNTADTTDPKKETRKELEETDPQMIELKGFIDPKEELEPILTDGTKTPDKKPPENVNG